TAPLEVYGPRGTAKMAEHLVQAYQRDVRIRVDGLEPANSTGYRVQAHEIEDGVVYRDERVTVKAFLVDHGSWKQAFGFRFETPDRTIVLSGDTRPTPRLIEAARGADILIHEVYSHARFQKRSPIWQRYHSSFHTSTLELGEIARQVRPRLLVLNHQLFWGASEEDLLREIASVYDGPVVSGRDLDRF
ncbi:MAG: MBL fold metallo-hydrolase, partial [Planctomycetota bacterium]